MLILSKEYTKDILELLHISLNNSVVINTIIITIAYNTY